MTMVTIPDKVKKMILKEQVLIVGTTNKKIANVSPRTTFHLDQDDSIYWLELFKHKTLRNLTKNSWCTIAVFNKKNLSGYQLKGKATVVSDRNIKKQITAKIIDRLTRLQKQRIVTQSKNKNPKLIKFTTKIVYTLNPNELADSPLALDATNESILASDMQW